MGRILFVVTNVGRIGPRDRPTGYEFSEVAHPFLVFAAEGIAVDFASPLGGSPPEDGFDPSDSASVLFRESAAFRRLNRSLRLADVVLERYDAVFFPGGLGPMVDLYRDPGVKAAVAHMHELGRVVGAVCHGPVALLDVRLPDGSNFLQGRRVAAFTSAEEEGHSLEDVPFLLDAALVRQGARHSGGSPFEAHVVVDGNLVTGQNPASARGVARAMVELSRSGKASTVEARGQGGS
ncbi:MAG TPA: type 1 glutamine amidotransferase domain-containing protein [Planctomycetes bacterium]|nr:type 1 glutamine amidotransferase domain-containing protein [Planctomycetota bacterium]